MKRKKRMIRKTNPIHSPSPVKVEEEEAAPLPLPLPPSAMVSSAMVSVKVERQELTIAGSLAIAPEKQEGEAAAFKKKKEEGEALFLKSVDEIRGLASALYTFRRCWDHFQKHIEFIQNAIDTRSKQLDTNSSIAPISAEELPAKSELELLCRNMSSRGLRKYIASRLSDISKLREEAPAALKRAPNPSKLVLQCIGRFYLQGIKAYCNASPMISLRQVSLLILEFFLLMDCTEIEPSVRDEAEVAAISWRKRLVGEGGVSNANEIDARGLLLFVASFGIPTVFGNEDLHNLILLSNPSEISDALRNSHFLLERVPGIIQGMVNNKMHIEAVDVAYTFGFEDKFSAKTVLTSFLRESKEVWKNTRRESKASPSVLKEANEKQIAALKSIIKCLENHKINPGKLLSGWQIYERIANLEKDIADLDKKIEEKPMSKRKADVIESSIKLKIEEVKRPRPTAKVSPLIRPEVTGSQEEKSAGLADGKSLYDGLVPKNLLHGGFPGLLNGYSAVSSITEAAVPDGRGMGPLVGNVFDTVAGINGGLAAAGILAAGVLPTGPHAGIGGRLPLGDGVGQMTNSGGSYGWHEDGAFNDNSVGQSFPGQPASMGRSLFRALPSVEQGPSPTQSLGLVNQSSGSDLYRFADSVFEGEQHYSSGSRAYNPMPPAASAHGSSFFY